MAFLTMPCAADSACFWRLWVLSVCGELRWAATALLTTAPRKAACVEDELDGFTTEAAGWTPRSAKASYSNRRGTARKGTRWVTCLR
jgi:hypothetical protein